MDCMVLTRKRKKLMPHVATDTSAYNRGVWQMKSVPTIVVPNEPPSFPGREHEQEGTGTAQDIGRPMLIELRGAINLGLTC